MIYFISNLNSYFQIYVIESEWMNFKKDLEEAKNLDEVRSIQEKFSEKLLDQSLLSNPKIDIYNQIWKIFDIIHKFKFTQDVLYTSAIEEL